MSELVLDAVTVSRGAGPVISDVSLRVNGGEVLALVGPNGAGKTSLIESISGVTPHSAGTITLDGEPIDKLSRVARARRGIVHIEQGRAVFPSLTVRENISLTARTPAELDAALAQFPELEKRIDSPTALLSGGEQQMVVLARAFAAKPRILLIDEMSLGLAPVVFLRLMPIVQSIAAVGGRRAAGRAVHAARARPRARSRRGRRRAGSFQGTRRRSRPTPSCCIARISAAPAVIRGL